MAKSTVKKTSDRKAKALARKCRHLQSEADGLRAHLTDVYKERDSIEAVLEDLLAERTNATLDDLWDVVDAAIGLLHSKVPSATIYMDVEHFDPGEGLTRRTHSVLASGLHCAVKQDRFTKLFEAAARAKESIFESGMMRLYQGNAQLDGTKEPRRR